MENIKGCIWWVGILAVACIAAYIFDGFSFQIKKLLNIVENI